MGDKMLLYSMEQLLNWISQEYQDRNTVFGIPASQFFRKKNNYRATIFGQDSDTFLGPAAGPHTQIAQNLITSYLCGGRFLELKTVQKMDNLVIPKPCIDALDEGYNTEW